MHHTLASLLSQFFSLDPNQINYNSDQLTFHEQHRIAISKSSFGTQCGVLPISHSMYFLTKRVSVAFKSPALKFSLALNFSLLWTQLA